MTIFTILIASLALQAACAALANLAYWAAGYPRRHAGRVWSGIAALIAGSTALWLFLFT